MMKQLMAVGSVGLLAMSLNANAGPIAAVDLFTTGQDLVESAINGTNDHNQAGSVGDTTILGGFRDLYVEALSGAITQNGIALKGTRMAVIEESAPGAGDNELFFSIDAGVNAVGEIVWDGSNLYDGTNLNFTGLGGLDLTNGGAADSFQVTTIESDLDWNFEIIAYSSATQWSRVNLPATSVEADGTPEISTISFNAFTAGACGVSIPNLVNQIECGAGGAADLTNLGALIVRLNVTEDGAPGGTIALDLRIKEITVPVPEPTTLALMGLGLLGTGFSVRRLNQASA